ncbi:MAG: thiamine pyrophosphate-binding protein [Lachnospiraceae bacterium]|nr:thiamine pyrophosphate-binding protein [Lachnospiraceae bacterium]
MTVSEFIFDFLQKKGVGTVYMVSGSSAMWLTDALCRNKDLKAVCCQHEQAAAMAADGYGRCNGIPGAALVTIGPGATNAVTGVAGAYVDSSPMFVISGQANSKILQYQKDTGIRQKGTQSLVLGNLVGNITKYFAEVMDPTDIRYHMERAYHEAMSGRKGPVWIDVPIDIQNKQIPEEMEGFETPEIQTEDVKWEEIESAITKAQKPLILAGYGILSAGVRSELLSFARNCNIPIVTSRGGIGVISSSDPLFVGRPGSYGDRASHFAVQECDLLLILGSRLAQSTTGYYPGHLAPDAVKIMVDIDEKELDKGDVPTDIRIQADLCRFIVELNTRSLAWKCKDHNDWIAHCKKNKEKYPVVQASYAEEEGINSYFFTQRLSELSPDGTTVVVDTGSVCNIVSQSWELKADQKYMISGGLSCMGFWASSIGAAANGETVIALSGDGSTQMNIQEFATLKYYDLPIKLFVYNNKGYMLIRHNQHNYMNDRFLGVGPDSGVPSVDFCAVGKAYDLPVVRIDDKTQIEEKVREVFDTDGPVICEVMVQEFGVIAPRIASRVMPDGSLKAAEFDDLWPFLDEGGTDA